MNDLFSWFRFIELAEFLNVICSGINFPVCLSYDNGVPFPSSSMQLATFLNLEYFGVAQFLGFGLC